MGALRDGRRRARAVAVLFPLLAACGGSAGDGPDPDDTVPQILECVREDYPCTEAAVPPEVVREGISLARTILRRLGDETGPSLLEWVRTQPGVVHAVGNGDVVRFRLSGGRPVWVFRVRAPARFAGAAGGAQALAATPEAPGTDRARPSSGTSFRPAAWRSPWGPLASLMPRMPTVHAAPVGRDRDSDGHITDRDPRRALVLDPFRWEWTRLGTQDAYREGTEVARILEATPGFGYGTVDYRADAAAGEHAFRGWHTYDLVHFTGHGHRICEEDGPCYTVLFTGDERPLDQIDDPSDTARETGIMEFEDPETGEIVQRRHVGLSSDWFMSEYGGTRLDRTMVFLNGCGTVDPRGHGFVPDFLRSLAGADTTIVGWDEDVPTLTAQKAAVSIYQHMMTDGVRVGDAVRRLPPELAATVNARGVVTRLRSGSGRGGGHDQAKLRLREVVALHAPRGARLGDGVPPPGVVKGAIGDDRNDALDLDLLVDGVEPEERDRWAVDLEMNGRTLQRGIRLASRYQIDKYAYRIPLRDVPLGVDLKEGQRDTLEAIARLPEGGESRTRVYFDYSNCYWKAEMSGTISRPLRGYGVWLGQMTMPGRAVGDENWVLSSITLGQAPGHHDEPDSLTFFIEGGTAIGDFPFSSTSASRHGAILGTREVPLGTGTRGRLRITRHDPGKLTVGGFALAYHGLALPDFENADLELRGEFVWTPACPTAADVMLDIGRKTGEFLKQRGIR